MKLLSIVNARSLWFCDIGDLNPRGADLTEELIEWVKERYEFTSAPDASIFTAELAAGRGFPFVGGRFQVREGTIVTVNLAVYADGFRADTKSSTKHSDAFLEDLLSSAAKDFGLAYEPGMILKKAYVSEVHVRTDRSITALNPKLAEFANRLRELTPNSPPEFEASGLHLWTSPIAAGLKPLVFSFERQVQKPFQERRYYSQAPVHTEDHLALLQEFEQILPA